ncbi:immunity 49 family protein [Streptomyces platensis]|uniref:immunity 49 family protein n=1 Tax=Streptomyces platensis TaxID=58346 RepID=UPI0037A29509
MLQSNAQELIDGLEAGTANLGDALGTTLTLAEAHCLMDPRAATFPTWDAWVNAMQVGSALFAAATTTKEHVQCRIAHKDRTLQATGPEWYVHPGSWLSAFYLAVMCREKDRITSLCRVPLSVLRENGSRFGEYDYAWIDTLQTYWLGGQDLVPKLVTAVDATAPEAIDDPETVGKLLSPPPDGDVPPLRPQGPGRLQPGAGQRALQWHKEYWSEEERAFQISGLVALAPLAMACIAHDAGIPIEVESEYLPAVLIKRNWCGEFPT